MSRGFVLPSQISPPIVAAASALTLIKTQTIGTAVASTAVADAFSATYDNYLITLNGGVASANQNLTMTLGATATGYSNARFGMNFSGSVAQGGDSNIAFWYTGTIDTNTNFALITVFSPFLNKRTTYSSSGCNNSQGLNQVGMLANTTSYTAFTLTGGDGATLTGGVIRVYGYSNS